MVRQIAKVLLLSLIPVLASAQLESTLNYAGQAQERVQIDGIIDVLRPVVVQVPSTCIRQVPRQERVCRDVTRYREECVRVPAERECRTEYEDVCRNVTRTRQECSRGPSRQECQQIPRREVCVERPTRQECTTSPTRQVCTDRPSRQECSPGPSRQVCTNNPSRQECSTGPSREVCTDVPGREVCVERPTREVCRTNSQGQNVCTQVGGGQSCQTVGGGRSCRSVPGEQSCRTVGGGQSCTTVSGDPVCRTVGGGQSCQTVGGEQSCRTVGGGQSCQTVGGGQECHSVPGEEICRNVSYQDRECDQVPRERCETIPAHNACNQIPYSQNVCGMETVNHPQEYACMKDEVQQQAMKKRLQSSIAVDIKTNGLMAEFPIQLILRGENPEGTSFALEAALRRDPNLLVVLKKKEVRVVHESKEDIGVEGSMQLEMVDPKTLQAIFPKRVSEAVLLKNSSALKMRLPGQMEAKGIVEISLYRKNDLIAVIKEAYPSPRIEVVQERRRASVSVNLAGILTGPVQAREKLTMLLTISSTLGVEGEILNGKKPVVEKKFKQATVKVE